MIKSDAIIDLRKLRVLNTIREKFSIDVQDELEAAGITLMEAVRTLVASSSNLKGVLYECLEEICISDKIITREEAVFMTMLKICLLKSNKIEGHLVSADVSSYDVESSQILYVEYEYDREINWSINENYRTIVSELMLVGFDFVYVPKIVERYGVLADDDLGGVARFLYPDSSVERINRVVRQIRRLNTVEVCKGMLSGCFKFQDVMALPPSVMFKIGDSCVNNKKTTNFLLVELENDVTLSIRKFVDLFSSTYQVRQVSCTRTNEGRFVYAGFFKQVFDMYMQGKCVQSSVVVDVYRNEIRFPEADVKLDKLHRREKALYTLFLLESASGGINFTKPSSSRNIERYKRRMDNLQEKYNLIYQKFGGDIGKAPNIEQSEIRLPMISLIKRKLKELDNRILGVDDYVIQRNFYGNYAINVPQTKCLCSGLDKNDIKRFSESPEWVRILAL